MLTSPPILGASSLIATFALTKPVSCEGTGLILALTFAWPGMMSLLARFVAWARARKRSGARPFGSHLQGDNYARQLQAAAEMAYEATIAENVNELIQWAVDMIRRRFGFHYVGLFLVGPGGDEAILRATSDDGCGCALQVRRSFPVSQLGILGYLTGVRQHRAEHARNPSNRIDSLLLPETRSAMIIPLKFGDRIIGALDVQRKESGEFDEQDEVALQAMADQLAVAIERKETEEQLTKMAKYDYLTGLPNRSQFHLLAEEAFARARRTEQMVALLFIDLDNFKMVNDSFGHAVGDQLLQMTAARMKGCLRKTDTICRLGGDEFIIIAEGIKSMQDAKVVAEKLIQMFAPAYEIQGHEIFATPSIGVAIFPTDGQDTDQLLSFADSAMYSAKKDGACSYRFYEIGMNAHIAQRITITEKMKRAIQDQEFEVFYQPQIELSSGDLVAVEALIRWRHPDGELVPPGQFIPVAESTGLIIPIGEWVLRTACQQAKRWHLKWGKNIRVAVNISPRQLRDPKFSQTVMNILSQTGLEAECLELEFTENVLIEHDQANVLVLNQLKDRGVRIAMDDFGTGYSSLSYLKRFPIDTIKIDHSFVRDIPNMPRDASLACAIIAMGHMLRLRVIAEGVETAEQLTFFRSQNCDAVQGYFFSEPLPADLMTEFMGDFLSEKPQAKAALHARSGGSM